MRLFCGNHNDTNELIMMALHESASGSTSAALYGQQLNMFYSCPKYYPKNRKPDEKCCRNHISIKEYEGMLNHLAKIMEECEAGGGTMDLVGERWKSKQGVEFCVFRHTENHIDVKCLNVKGLRE